MESKKKGLIVTLLLALCHIAGLIRVLLISYVFGSGRIADLISYSFSYPNQARKKIEEGTGNLALIRMLGENKGEGIPLFLLLLHLGLLLIILILSPLLSSLAFHFTAFTPDEIRLGTVLFSSFLIFLVIYNYAANLGSYLQIRGKKELSALLASIPSIIAIAALLLLTDETGAYAFSIGLLAGALIYLILSFFLARCNGMRFSHTADLERGFIRLYSSSFLLILLSVLESVPLFLSSAMIEKGSIYFSNAYTLILLPYGFLIELFTILVYPEMAKCDRNTLKAKALDGLYLVSFLSLSISLLLSSFSSEICVFLFEGGDYLKADALQTASILVLLSPSVCLMCLFSYYQRMMFLTFDNKTILITILGKIVLSYILLFTLPSTLYKSSLILLLSSAFAIILSFIFSTALKRKDALRSIIYSLIAALPLIALAVVKDTIKLNNFFNSKTVLLLTSLTLGIIVFLSSCILFMAIKKGSRFLQSPDSKK